MTSESFVSFFNDNIRPKLPEKKLNILDLGVGNYSFFEEIQNLNADIWAFDFSPCAIAKAPQSKIHYLMCDITDSSNFFLNFYDLIFDSHCLNCLITEDSRQKAFKNIYSGLALGGWFVSEMMVQPIGGDVLMPNKWVRKAHELEAELISYGFKIRYFMISKDFTFSNVLGGGNLSEVKCDMLKIMAQKIPGII